MTRSRPRKLSDSQTMLYEIDMLRHTAKMLAEGKWKTELDEWGCLESFLVHFRNLIEFFGRPEPPRRDDLHISKPDNFWPDDTQRPPKDILQKLVRHDLWETYEGDKPDKISKYLHHCTEARTHAKDWEVGRMFHEIEKTLTEFEQLLPNARRTWDVPSKSVTLSTSCNLSTASGPMILQSPEG